MERRSTVIALAFVAAFWGALFAIAKWPPFWTGGQTVAEDVAVWIPRLPEDGELPNLWDAPAFSYVDQSNRPFTDRDLRGQVWISNFFFTSCTSVCPLMTAKLSQLQKSITNPAINFVSFSVDPDRDSPKVLHEYAEMWKADTSRWHFLSTDRQRLPETAAGMKIFVKVPEKDTLIEHSAIFILTDGWGKVRGVYDSNDGLALKRLAVDAMSLAGTPLTQGQRDAVAWEGLDREDRQNNPGAVLYRSRGCVACHAQAGVAPTLNGILGRAVLLDNGTKVVVDRDYIRESIISPNSKIVAGYPRLMPAYGSELSSTEVEQLVDYVESLKGGQNSSVQESQSSAAAEAIDPVCGMTVSADDKEPPAQVYGETYYFCSSTCREEFLKDPEKFGARAHIPEPAGEVK